MIYVGRFEGGEDIPRGAKYLCSMADTLTTIIKEPYQQKTSRKESSRYNVIKTVYHYYEVDDKEKK